MQQPTKEAPMGMVKDAALFAKGEVRRAVEEMQRVLRRALPVGSFAAPAASPRPLASLHPWQTTRRPSPCPSGPPLLVVASQPADEGAPPFGSGILTNSWAHIGLHPWPQLREPSTPGSVREFLLCGYDYPVPCVDCLGGDPTGPAATDRGGSYAAITSQGIAQM